ncbi:hypothetical protein TSUD_320350 [Trifolium subterraneum]|uniref:Uncharacterized protein n=1 Tax=Trifolium subterraneum TaxID=3900 RepID=A0A2Z6NHJ4_TRISU|nr:hypothetical protein TSUD_320350 [Trifolium subterraneum]
MSNKSPIFPISDPQHFSDYGFDPQINYFQVLEEAMKHKREGSRSIDSIHFKLQKPISKEESRNKYHNQKSKKKRWWKNALFFFKRKWAHNHHRDDDNNDIHQARAKAFRASISGPVYLTESRSGSTTPYRSTSRPSSGPLAGTLMPAAIGAVDIPYLSLRELTMEQQQMQQQRMSTSAMPIYFVT